MYLEHFNINKYPFELTPNTEFSCNYRGHQEALNTLLFSIGNGEWIVKIIGEVGYGKTFLCRELLNCLVDPFVVVYIPNPDLSVTELKRLILCELHNKQPIDVSSDADLTQLIFERILYYHDQEKRVIIVIDEAQVLSDKNLETLRLLTNMETESKRLLQIVLFAQPELDLRLACYSLRQFNQRITFSYKLTPLDRLEINKYIAERLIIAGHPSGYLFTSAAQRLLHRASKSVPRIINILAHKSMLAAYGKGIYKVDYWAVRQAIKDSKKILTTQDKYWSWDRIAVLALFTMLAAITISAIKLFFN